MSLLTVGRILVFFPLPQAFNHAILHLADEPAIALAIREQTEKIVDEEGWTKVSLSKMTKLDAFLRESQRLNGSNLRGSYLVTLTILSY